MMGCVKRRFWAQLVEVRVKGRIDAVLGVRAFGRSQK